MRHFLKLILISLLIFVSSNVFADYYYQQNATLASAYKLANSLQLDEAQKILDRLKITEPKNLLIHHVENYIDFYRVFILEEYDLFKLLEKNKEKRLKLLQKGPKNSPYFLFSQSEIRLQWALARLKFEEYYTAFIEVKTAYHSLIKNTELFPDFIANKKSLGIIHAVIGTLPDKYQWGIKLISGMKGNLKKGKSEIQAVLNYYERNDFLFFQETEIMYAFLLFHLMNEKKQAWETIKNTEIDYKTNLLGVFVKSIIAIEYNKSELAIQLLEQAPRGTKYLDFFYLDYLHGELLLNNLDPAAKFYFDKFINSFKGRHYIKKAYQRLSWYDLIFNKGARFKTYKLAVKNLGHKMTDQDKTAYNAVVYGQKPNIILLKARLLFDGNHFKKAETILNECKVNDFNTLTEQTNFQYRRGRVAQLLQKNSKAINYFRTTILNGANLPEFYACSAALQSGLIYESIGLNKKAKSLFKQCLRINPKQYIEGLHSKAKAGLKRLP